MRPDLPAEYIAYVRDGGPTDGFTDFEIGGYFELEELDAVDKFNTDIEVDLYAPGFVAFAGNGSGEFFAFDNAGAVYTIPLIGMSVNEAIKVADSWTDFVSHVVPKA